MGHKLPPYASFITENISKRNYPVRIMASYCNAWVNWRNRNEASDGSFMGIYIIPEAYERDEYKFDFVKGTRVDLFIDCYRESNIPLALDIAKAGACEVRFSIAEEESKDIIHVLSKDMIPDGYIENRAAYIEHFQKESGNNDNDKIQRLING